MLHVSPSSIKAAKDLQAQISASGYGSDFVAIVDDDGRPEDVLEVRETIHMQTRRTFTRHKRAITMTDALHYGLYKERESAFFVNCCRPESRRWKSVYDLHKQQKGLMSHFHVTNVPVLTFQ